MAIGLKKPDDVAGAAWPAIAIGLFVAFVSLYEKASIAIDV